MNLLDCLHIILFFILHPKSLVIIAIWLALIDTIYSRIAPFVSLNCTFFPANEKALLKHDNQSDFNACSKWPIK